MISPFFHQLRECDGPHCRHKLSRSRRQELMSPLTLRPRENMPPYSERALTVALSADVFCRTPIASILRHRSCRRLGLSYTRENAIVSLHCVQKSKVSKNCVSHEPHNHKNSRVFDGKILTFETRIVEYSMENCLLSSPPSNFPLTFCLIHGCRR